MAVYIHTYWYMHSYACIEALLLRIEKTILYVPCLYKSNRLDCLFSPLKHYLLTDIDSTMGFFSSTRPPQPTTVPSDEIIPLHFWNTALCMRGTVLDVSLKFDDVLDVSKLRDALDRLLEMEDWRQLGARLRMNVGSLRLISDLHV
jgi:hypothetical protein